MNGTDNNQITPEERAAIVGAKNKAMSSIVILATGMGLWAGSVFVNGGYTTQPEHHDMWRMVAILPAIWGIVLLVTYRYSWSSLIGAIVMSVSGFYLASAPTLPDYAVRAKDERREAARVVDPVPFRSRTVDSSGDQERMVVNLPEVDPDLSRGVDEAFAKAEADRQERENEIRSLLNFCRQIQIERGQSWTRPQSLEEAPCTISEMEQRRVRFEAEYFRRHPELARNQ
jgi:hypothetical protein